MAKIAFSKLKIKTNTETKTIELEDNIVIEVKQYLPIQEKLELIGNVIMQAHEEDNNYSNPVKVSVYRDLAVVFAYTNLSFTDKQKEDLPKLYDMLKSSGLLTTIIMNIPEAEYFTICAGLEESIESIYKYQNSILGLLDTIKTDYSNMKLDINSLNEAITDPELLGFVKDMLTNIN